MINKSKYAKRAKLIYNPFSGGGKILEYLDDIFEIYQSKGYLIDIFRISFNSNYSHILEDIDVYDHFLISGGDGTVNHIINIIKKANKNIPIAILPCGTANDFATFINMPKNIKKACQQILESKPQAIDIGIMNEKYFINVASIGIFSEISHSTQSSLKKNLGSIAYYLNAIKELPKIKKVKISIEIDSFKHEEEIIAALIFNGKTAGLLELAKEASLYDGLLNVILIKSTNILDVINMLKNLISKDKFDTGTNGVSCFTTSNLKLELLNKKHLETDLDGEKGPDFPLEIKCIKGGIKILGIKNS